MPIPPGVKDLGLIGGPDERPATVHAQLAQRIADLSVAPAQNELLLGPVGQVPDGSWGRKIVFRDPMHELSALWLDLGGERPLRLQQKMLIAAFKGHFRAVSEFDSALSLATAAMALWPCRRAELLLDEASHDTGQPMPLRSFEGGV